MPNNYIQKSNTKRENQHFFLNTTEIFGIQNIEASYSQNVFPLKFIGMGKPVMVPDGPLKSQCNLECLAINSDPFIRLTGNTGFNGYIVKGRDNTNENFSFTSGYLTSYNSKCSIGEIPQIGAAFTVFGNMGRLNSGESSYVSGQLATISGGSSSLSMAVAGPGSITLNLDDFLTNRVLSYDLSINVNRNAIYPLGTRAPTAVEINYPIEILVNFQFAMNDYVPQNLYSFPLTPKVKNLSLVLRAFDTNNLITSYVFNDLFLTDESQSAGTDGSSAVINASYRGYISTTDTTGSGSSGTSGV